MLARCATRAFLGCRPLAVRTTGATTCNLEDPVVGFTARQQWFIATSTKFDNGSGNERDSNNDSRDRGRQRGAGGGVLLAGVFLLPLGNDEKQPQAQLSKKEKEALLKKADQLHEDYEYDEEYELLMKYAMTTDPDLLWRAARVSIMRRDSVDIDSPDIYQKLTVQGFTLATKGRELGAEHPLCLLWYGITLNHMQTYRSTKQQIDDVYTMNQVFKRAVELNPKHAYSWHCLGQWHFHVADTSWIKWQAVRVMYRDLPKSTYEEALMCFNQAELLDPGFYSGNLWYLAQCYMRLKEKDKTYTLLWKIINYQAVTEQDKSFREKAKFWLNLEFNENIHDDYEDPKAFTAKVTVGLLSAHDEEEKEKLRKKEDAKRKLVNERAKKA